MQAAARRTLVVLAVLGFGAAAVAQAPAGPPVQEAILKAAAPGSQDHFATAVALDGDTLLVGAEDEDGGSPGINGDPYNDDLEGAGAAYVFVFGSSGWTQQAYLKAPAPKLDEELGAAVAISGDLAVVGAPRTTLDGVRVGAAHVYERSGGTWSHVAELRASNPGFGDTFGASVAVSGDTIAVGAPNEDSMATGVDGDQANDNSSGSGAVYVFVRDGAGWTQQAYIKASNTGSVDHFGEALALDGDTLVAGASEEDSAATGINGNQANELAEASGAAYVFTRSGTTWTQQAYLKASNAQGLDQFGRSLALSGDSLAVGAPGEAGFSPGVGANQGSNGAAAAGAVYVFTRAGTTWTQQVYIKAQKPGTGDIFGFSVGLAGDLLVVGTPSDDSSSSGVNNPVTNNALQNAGAASVYTRAGSTWTFAGYLKASLTSVLGRFGDACAASGSLVAVGAGYQNGNAPGVNGDQTLHDPTASHTGAAYVFDLDPEPWTDLTFGLAGTAGAPLLAGTGPATAGSPASIDLSGAAPGASSFLVVGLHPLVKPFKQGVLVPVPSFLVPLATDGAGAWALSFTWPSGIPAGAVMYLQTWVTDAGAPGGFAASNALEAVAH